MDSAQPAGRADADRTPDDRTAADPAAAAPGADPAGARTAVTTRPSDGRGASDTGADPAPAVEAPVGRRPRDMALSMLVLLVPLALLLGTYRLLFDGDEPVRYDATPVVAEARAAKFPVVEPAGLDDDWRTVSARFRRASAGTAPGEAPRPGVSPTAAAGATLRIGYVTPSGAGVQLVQSDLPSRELIRTELTGAGRPVGTVQLGGRTWQRHTAREGERALVLVEPNRTVIVIGAAREQELDDLAGSLR